MTISGNFDYGVSPCPSDLPNPVNSNLAIDFRSKYKNSSGTKIALRFTYSQWADINGVTTIYPNYATMSGALFARLGQQVTTVDSSAGPIPVITYINSIGTSDKPQFDVYYTINTVNHSLVFNNFPLTDAIV